MLWGPRIRDRLDVVWGCPPATGSAVVAVGWRATAGVVMLPWLDEVPARLAVLKVADAVLVVVAPRLGGRGVNDGLEGVEGGRGLGLAGGALGFHRLLRRWEVEGRDELPEGRPELA